MTPCAANATTRGHLVVVPEVTWGHVRPLLHLTVNLLIAHPRLHATILLAPQALSRVSKELESEMFRHIHSGSPAGLGGGKEAGPLINRLQIISVLTPLPFPVPSAGAATAYTMEDTWAALLSGSEDIAGEQKINAFADTPPQLVIFDAFLPSVPPVIRTTVNRLGVRVPSILTFAPSSAAAMFHWYAIKDRRGYLDSTRDYTDRAIAGGMSEEEAWAKYNFFTDGRVVDIAGLPRKFDYEYFPQIGTFVIPLVIAKAIAALVDGFRDPDTTGLIIPMVQELEAETQRMFERETGKPLLMAGLQFPADAWDGASPSSTNLSTEEVEVVEFLDRMLAERGPRTVAYVSWGSLFFPEHRPELALWLLQSLTANGVPFVYAHASELYPIPDNVIEVAESNPIAVAIKFAPQWRILQHPATAFFVSHCGANSVAEAILSGVPIISFPFAADQGEYVAALEQLGAVLDLKQVKTFREPSKWNKLYDGTEIIGTEAAIKAEMMVAWADMLGAKGDALRARTVELKEIARKSKDEGTARKVIEGLSKYF